MRPVPQVDIGTHLSEQEVITYVFSNNDAINNAAVLSSSSQCPSCLHYVFEGTLICKCGKLMRPNKDVMKQSEGTIPPHIYDCDKW